MPLFSICVLADSRIELLTKSLQSVSNQTFDDWEVVLAVPPGLDNALLQKWHQREKVRLVSVSSQKTAALNDVLKAAEGKLALFLQVGDELEPHCLQAFAQAFAVGPEVVLIAGGHNLCTQDGTTIECCTKEFDVLQNEIFSGREVVEKMLVELQPSFEHTSSVCFRTEYAAHGFDDSYFLLAQFEFFLRLISNGDCLVLSDCICKANKFERQAENQIVRRSMIWLADIVRLRDTYKKFLKAEQLERVHDDFYAANWAGQELVYAHLSQQILKYPGPAILTSDQVCEAVFALNEWPREHLLESYAKLTFEFVHSLRALNWWRHHAAVEAQQRIEEAYQRGLLDGRERAGATGVFD